MAFTIEINEQQRALIVAALAQVHGSVQPSMFFETDDEALLLQQMLVDLPQAEKESPGCVHGLCL